MTRRWGRRLWSGARALAHGALLCAVAALAILPAAIPALPPPDAAHGTPGIVRAVPWCGAPLNTPADADRDGKAHDAGACLLHCLRHAPTTGTPALRPHAVEVPLPTVGSAPHAQRNASVAPQHLLDQDPARGPPAV